MGTVIYDLTQPKRQNIPRRNKAQFDDTDRAKRRRLHKLAKRSTRWSKSYRRSEFRPIKIYTLSDQPLDYPIYLKSQYWLALRGEVLATRDKCEDCGTSDHLNLHHLYYYKGGKSVLYRERQFADIFEVLCFDCHMKRHNACSPAVLEVRG